MTRDPAAVESSLVELVRDLSARAGRPAEEPEIGAALAPLSAGEEKELKSHAKGKAPAQPLGPMAWADIARGVDPMAAAARELGGYYELLAERSALAVLKAGRGAAQAASPSPSASRSQSRSESPSRSPSTSRSDSLSDSPAPARAASGSKARAAAAVVAGVSPQVIAVVERAVKRLEEEPEVAAAPRGKRTAQQARIDELMTLYAYHRDTPLVAKALRLSLSELEAEIDTLRLRRKVGQIVRGSDLLMPMAQSRPGVESGPPVRRRKSGEKPVVAPRATRGDEVAKPLREERVPSTQSWGLPGGQLREHVNTPRVRLDKKLNPGKSPRVPLGKPAPKEPPLRARPFSTDELRALLRDVGPRRHLLQEKMGPPGKPLPQPLLLNAFRDAGLEREFGQRERDLVRGLVSLHKGLFGPVAKELALDLVKLTLLIKERGLTRELEGVREKYVAQARSKRWPQDQLAQLLKDRERLEDLGVFEELKAAASERVAQSWNRDPKSPQPARLQRLGKELKLQPADARKLAELLGLR